MFCTSIAFADYGGRVGRTQTGCGGGGCHTGAGTATTVSVSGPTTLTTGSTGTYTLTVAHTTLTGAGCNIKIANSGGSNAGTLAPASGSGLYLSSGELTHSSPKSMSGSASFSFTWTAPTSAGTYNIYAVGNAVNMNNSASGDLFNYLASQPYQIVVSAPSNPTLSLTMPTGGQQWCAGSAQNITWTSTNITNVKIELSINGGTSFTSTLATSVSAASGTYSWAIPTSQTPGTSYKIRISDASNAATNSVSASSFSILGTPSITVQPIPQTTCVGSSVTYSVAGTNYSTISWYKLGSTSAIGSGTSYTIGLVQQSHEGIYYAIVSGCGTNIGSDTAHLIVKSPPTITQQPLPQAVCNGGSATISVNATGTGTLSYAWRKDGQLLSNVTPTLTIPSATASDAGTYTVTVTGDCTPTQSNAVLLKINPATAIVAAPQSATTCAGQNAQFYVQATGANLTYQWKKNGNDISGKTQSALTLTNVTIGDAGSYSVIVTGSCGNLTSIPAANLIVKQLPVVSQNPLPQTITVGSTATFTVLASGDNLTYQWFKNGSLVSGATGSTLTISNAKLTDAGNYNCMVSGYCSPSSSSATAKLTVNTAGPGPLTISVTSIDFGNVLVNSTKDSLITTFIKNTGNSDVKIVAWAFVGTDAEFFKMVDFPTPVFTLKPNETSNITIRFAPTSAGVKTATLQITSNSASNPTVNLTGGGSNGTIIVAVNKNFDFGKVNISTNKDGNIQVSNTGTGEAMIDSLKIIGSNKQYFNISSPTNFPIRIASMQSQNVVITFSSPIVGTFTSQLQIFVRDLLATPTVDLTATVETAGGVSEPGVLSQKFWSYPNPAFDGAMISFTLREPGNYELSIVDMMGIIVQKYSGFTDGTENILWNGEGCSSGTYRAILKVNGGLEALPILLVR